MATISIRGTGRHAFNFVFSSDYLKNDGHVDARVYPSKSVPRNATATSQPSSKMEDSQAAFHAFRYSHFFTPILLDLRFFDVRILNALETFLQCSLSFVIFARRRDIWFIRVSWCLEKGINEINWTKEGEILLYFVISFANRQRRSIDNSFDELKIV